MVPVFILDPAIPEGGSMDWKSQPLLVPPLPPTMSSSKYININYLVRLSVDVPMAFDLELKLPVTIGTVPYLPVYNEPPPDEKPLISQKQYGKWWYASLKNIFVITKELLKKHQMQFLVL